MALLLKHQTTEAFVVRFREAYRNSEQENTIKLANFLISKIQSGDITDTQARNAFGLNAGQWNALKVKMNNLLNAHAQVRGATGE